MKQLIIWVASLTLALNAFPQEQKPITNSQAKQIVSKFYKAVQATPSVNINDFYHFVQDNVFNLIIDSKVFVHPADIQLLLSQADSENCKLIYAYLGDLQRLGRDHNIKIDYQISDVKDLREVVYRNDRERIEPTYWSVNVDKTITIDGNKHILKDTVDVKIQNGNIAFISNRLFRQNYNFSYKGGENIESRHNELIVRAARFWSQGRKREAYNSYVESVRDYEDPETLFRIGLLLINHRKECTNLSKREAESLAHDYFSRAANVGQENAIRVLRRWWGSERGHNL